ncbi:MAG: class I SAM-dependent methyltransferase [Candidatus Omnitrophota bacterium]|nr:class I SAM-dependent methyltransferase [Candidatus Omnitrophota bacterium]
MNTDDYYGSEREDIIALIPPDARRVLDVGCGFGLMGKRLKQKNSAIEVVGLEAEGKAAETAKKNIDKVITGDVEGLKMPFQDRYFDCLVYGEVLEHLKNPWQVLKEHASYLKKGGCCILSMPNISHYSIIEGLLRDKWDYKDSGILDNTHLRFFTINGIRKMLNDAGYIIEDEKRYIQGSRVKKAIGKLLGKRAAHLLTEQYLIKGRLA